MSNHTPAAIRAKDKARKAQEKHPKQVKNEQTAPRRSGVNRLWSVIVVMITLIGGIFAGLSYFPRLEVSPGNSVSSHEALGTIFNLTNNGLLTVLDVVHNCQVEAGDGAGGGLKGILLGRGDGKLGNLEAGMTKSLSCERTAGGAVTASMTIWITYRSVLWPLKITKPYRFEAERADDGTWVWKSV